MPKYKHGKQIELMEPQIFRNFVEKARLTNEKEAFVWILFHSGSRKSESYERTVDDVKVTPEFLIVDYGERKKHSARTPPLKFSRTTPGIETIIKQHQAALKLKPQKKTIYYQENKQTLQKKVKAKWLFPNVGKQTAWRLVKQVLGKEYYPHYLRLNCISEVAQDPTANITRLKSHSGIKTVRVLEAYLGVSEKEQDAARKFRERKWRE